MTDGISGEEANGACRILPLFPTAKPITQDLLKLNGEVDLSTYSSTSIVRVPGSRSMTNKLSVRVRESNGAMAEEARSM